MSLCYDFQKWTMIALASVAISLSVGLLMHVAYGQIEYNSKGQECTDILQKHPTLVIIDIDCEKGMETLIQYSELGYEIKLKEGNIIFMQKVNITK